MKTDSKRHSREIMERVEEAYEVLLGMASDEYGRPLIHHRAERSDGTLASAQETRDAQQAKLDKVERLIASIIYKANCSPNKGN